MYKFSLKVLNFLDNEKKSKLFYLLLLTFIASVFEIFNLGLIVSLISVIIDNKSVYIFDVNVLDNNYIKDLDDKYLLLIFSISIVFITLIKTIFLVLFNFFLTKVAYAIRYESAANLFKGYIKSSYLYHKEKNSAILIRNINASRSIGFASLAVIELVSEIIMLSVLIVFIISFLSLKALVVLFFLCSVSFIYYRFFRSKIINWSFKVQSYEKDYLQNIQEGIGSIRDIIIFNLKSFFVNRFDRTNKEMNRLGVYLNVLPSLSRYFLEFVVVVIFVFVIIFSLYINENVDQIFITLSFLALFMIRLYPSLNKIISKLQAMNNMVAPVSLAINEINEINKNSILSPQKQIFENFKSLNLKNISFSYNKGNKILDELNFQIKKNDIIGIVGQSGSGKTTLVDIISGLIKIDNGRIILNDNVDFDKENKKIKISYLPQFVNIIDDTMIKNITFQENLAGVDNEKLDRSLKLSELKSFTDTLDNKLHTKIGEKGSKISGGQRQRVGIARALYFDSDLIILDEPTSMLDKETADMFIKNLAKLKNAATIIFISHNLKNLEICNKIYELKNGKLH